MLKLHAEVKPVELRDDACPDCALHEVPQPVISIGDHLDNTAAFGSLMVDYPLKLVSTPIGSTGDEGEPFAERTIAFNSARGNPELS